MTTHVEKAAVEGVGAAIARGLHERDAGRIAAHYAPDAEIFDLAPPLAHRFDEQGLAGWIATWRGPIEQESRDMTVLVSGDLAVCYGLARTRATTAEGGEDAQWWQRITTCLQKRDGAWKVIHEHSSVPFHMDGSYRAAIDLEP